MILQAVFLIKSPLQYLNALEALAFYQLRAEETLWLFLADSKSRHQLGALVASERDAKVAVFLSALPLTPTVHSLFARQDRGAARFSGNALFSIVKLTRLARLFPEVPMVFLGDLANPLMRHYVNSLNSCQVVHLDDGVATLDYAHKRKKAVPHRDTRWRKRLKLGLKRRLLGLRDEELPQLTFFTLYRNLQVGSGDLVVANNFADLRQRLSALLRGEKIYFLGGPLVEAEILSEESYLALLTEIAGYYQNDRVVYVAHRRENPQRLKLIEQKTGWETVLFEYPIEYQLARVGPLPKQMSSLFSSALETCQLIFGEQLDVCSFQLSQELMSSMSAKDRRAIERVYTRLRELMPVIDLSAQG